MSRLNSKVIVTAKDLLNGTPTKLLTEGFTEGRSDTEKRCCGNSFACTYLARSTARFASPCRVTATSSSGGHIMSDSGQSGWNLVKVAGIWSTPALAALWRLLAVGVTDRRP